MILLIISGLILLGVGFIIYLMYNIRLFPNALDELLVKFLDISNRSSNNQQKVLQSLVKLTEKHNAFVSLFPNMNKSLEVLNRLNVDLDSNNVKLEDNINNHNKVGREVNSTLKHRVSDLETQNRKLAKELMMLRSIIEKERK
tara:strand:- start:11891 stop:12319 length:429 start_codon:yes stop_codon:yes gene_type:complete